MQVDIDEDTLFGITEDGEDAEDGSIFEQEFYPAIASVSHKISKLKETSALVDQYRVLQHLELTKLQSDILDAITPDKISGASLRDLVISFKILKEKELLLEGKPSDIKGLVGYLVQLEKDELKKLTPEQPQRAEVIDITPKKLEELDLVPTV